MLRFDLPRVPANVIRFEAFLVFVVVLLALAFTPWLLLITAVQGLVKGFFGHTREPLHRLWTSLFKARGWQGKLEDAGAKMFAAKLLFIASTVALVLAASGSGLWKVPAGVLVLFSFLEWALAFCAGCWAYGAWYKRFPPSGT
jgi:hypothetical protein